jgi:hypothetical protein
MTECINGNCDDGTNLNKGHYILTCSNDQCGHTAEPKPIDIEKWYSDQQYRIETTYCPRCNNVLILTPRKPT